MIGAIALFPIRVLFLPVELFLNWRDGPGGFRTELERKPSKDQAKKRKSPRNLLGKTKHWSKKITAGAMGRLRQCSRTDLLLATLPLAMLAFLGFVFFQVYAHADDIEARYRQGAQAAMDANDIPLAKTYFSRIVSEHELNEHDRLNWATILSVTGETARAQQVLDELAPDDHLGYVPAHRAKALALANLLKVKKDAETLRKLRTHLEFAADNTPQVNHAWAMYYLAVEQTDTALGYLGAAARMDPQFLITIADINQRIGRRKGRDRALRQAESEYRKLLVRDPLDAKTRVTLASLLARLERLKEAEQTLLTGLRLSDDVYLRQAAADYYVMQYDLATRAGKPFSDQFTLLQKALAQDDSYLPVYERLTRLYQRHRKEDSKSIKDALLTAVASDKPSAMAHFALSNVNWIDGDHEQAQWHVKQAYELDPEFVIVVNNLAWMLAHKKENPDLERALTLAETALKTAPTDYRFLDTYGSILILQKKYEQAITSLQKALPTKDVQVGKSIHEKLAVCYNAIGQPELARAHSEQAAQSIEQVKQR